MWNADGKVFDEGIGWYRSYANGKRVWRLSGGRRTAVLKPSKCYFGESERASQPASERSSRLSQFLCCLELKTSRRCLIWLPPALADDSLLLLPPLHSENPPLKALFFDALSTGEVIRTLPRLLRSGSLEQWRLKKRSLTRRRSKCF